MTKDGLSIYERLNNWPVRLARELPFLTAQLNRVSAKSVLDIGCATGRHSVSLAQRGYKVTAADPEVHCLRAARLNARQAGVRIVAKQTALPRLPGLERASFDGAICLGNTLALVHSRRDLAAALRRTVQILRPGGILLIQIRNYARVLREEQRLMPPTVRHEKDGVHIFLRYTELGNEIGKFSVIHLAQHGNHWDWSISTSDVGLWRHTLLRKMLKEAGFARFSFYGSYAGDAYKPLQSPDLIIAATTAQRHPPNK